MSLTYTTRFGINDLTGMPKAILHGGPFNGSVIELNNKRCQTITLTEDDTVASYHNTHSTDSKDRHIFLSEKVPD